MNSLTVAIIGIAILIAGYKFYGKIMTKLWDIDENRPTPATTLNDGTDYVPAKHWTILFGHHFSSIAGAGPIIGPVIACAYFGWLPALLWVVFGTIFIGGVHDFSSLIISVRNNGHSIGDITEKVMGKKIKIIFSLLLFLALVLIIAVFAASAAQTLVNEPKIVVPTFGLIIVAVFVGFMIYVWKKNYFLSSAAGLLLLVLLFFLGNSCPVNVSNIQLWVAVLLVYSYIASVIPVQILLQPRDYLSAFLLFFGLVAGYAGIIVGQPAINVPVVIGYKSSVGNLWPMMFVLIACGAISGFHALVSSGTTSKQITNEHDALRIGYGAMVVEGILAILAIMAVSAGLYWHGSGAPVSLVYPEMVKSGDYIGTFAAGYGEITKPIFGSVIGKFIAVLILNAFVMTTLDSATRIARYIVSELFGSFFNIKILLNKYFATLLVVSMAGLLAFGDWKKIWPIFGATNQLIAAIALIVISLALLAMNKPIKYTFYPAVFMLVTSVYAVIQQTVQFYIQKNFLLVVIGLVLLLLISVIVVEAISIFSNRKKAGAMAE